ncbi:MAG: hypothetical protein H7328_02400 [Bdellovibrio sp.]|nr:hypothetical protein [Bdellovibrio sp.]
MKLRIFKKLAVIALLLAPLVSHAVSANDDSRSAENRMRSPQLLGSILENSRLSKISRQAVVTIRRCEAGSRRMGESVVPGQGRNGGSIFIGGYDMCNAELVPHTYVVQSNFDEFQQLNGFLSEGKKEAVSNIEIFKLSEVAGAIVYSEITDFDNKYSIYMTLESQLNQR